jgi:DNA-binding beta-propeller fold protein YncE
MNQPWDVAVADDGSIFVADTFNHRIQKLGADGTFIKMWGTFAQGTDPESMWGPRGIVIDKNGHLLVTDTGNKRVLIFDQNLNYLSQFGSAGFDAGQFDEPVGIAVSQDGKIVVADTWNRRVQIFEADESGQTSHKSVPSMWMPGMVRVSITSPTSLSALTIPFSSPTRWPAECLNSR